MTDSSLAAIVVAAGQGSRLGAAVPKAFVDLGGYPLFHHSLATFASLANLRQLVLVVAAERIADVSASLTSGPPLPIEVEVVAGGSERQDSVAAGLARVRSVALVAVHDAARPFVRSDTILACVRAAADCGAALVALPAQDTIKIADEHDRVMATPERRTIWQAQTPQIFHLDVLRRAHARAADDGFAGTDDAQLVERLGLPVRLVPGEPRNRKITTEEDLRWARWLVGDGAR